MDFKNIDIATGPVIADLNSADAAVALEAAATLAVALQSGAILLPTADGQLVLPAGVGLDDIKVSGRDLIIQMPDGTQMVVPDGAIFVPQIVVDGVAVPPLNIAALLIGQEPQPAAGRPQSSGGNFADPVGDIGDPFDLGDLLPPTQLAFPEPEEREIIPGLNDEEPTTIIVTPDQPAGSVNATASVQEAALPARGNEPSGSNPSSNGETTTGSIVFDTPDGLGSVTLNGTAITAVGQTIVTPLGTLTITSIAAGNIGYSYTLTDNTTAAASTDVFAVVVTDRDGDTAAANLTINIADDVPTARNDTDGVAAGTYSAQTGNVVTGAGTTSGATGADTQGADGAAVSGARAGTATGAFAGTGTVINGQYGTLTIAANGNYTYTRNPGTPGGVNDVFTYQLTDGDGDNSTATLTIAIADSPAVITFVPTVGEGTVVSEVGLPPRGTEPAGSNPSLPVESTSGTITYVAPDGPATVQINGVTITAPGQTITTPTGVLTVTSVAPGAIGYTFTLTDNTAGNTTSQTFTVTVTDVDGDAASAPLVITIVDDAPTARDDAATQATENAPVTVNVFANDTQGADGVSLTSGVALVAGSLSGAGSLAYNSDGTFTYTPAAGEQGTVTFQYAITDGDGDVSTATATITLLRDSVPTVDVAGDSDVAESGLPARGEEPAGSDSAANSEVANGTIAISTGGDSIASLVINGTNVTAGGTVTTATGTLVITLSEGTYSYSYTLTDNTSGDASTDSFTVTLTDSDGDVATDTLIIAIADDLPTAVADTDSVAAGSYAPATGNVITDSEADGGKDVQGADGVTVTNVTGFGGSGAAGTAVNGQYGILTIDANGSYSYVRNAGTAGGVSDIFSYTITDGDGDTSTTTLTISIADSPTSLDLPVKGEAGTSVNEAGLPAGSDAASNSETTAGTISYVAPDGPATVTIDGVAVATVGQTFAGAFGTITITSIANGAVGYNYTLTTNTLGDATFDDFAVVVTDQDGDNTPGTLVIDIVDDVPTARADVDSVTEDNYAGESESVSADGNVITGIGGSDANATDGTADTKGADGATVTAVAFGATPGAVDGVTAGAYGQLTLNANGSYSYVLNNFNPLVQGLDGDDTLTEIFTYTLTDGDGDTRETTLTVTINGSDDPISINGLNVEGPELILDEDDLSDGSDTIKEPLTQTGTFTVNGADGISSMKIEGDEATVGQRFTTAYGTFTITSIVTNTTVGGDPTSITVGYSYQLTDNTAHANAGGENFLTDTFGIDVTDTDGSTDSATIEVRIVDDVPTAVVDGTTQAIENSPVTIDVLSNDIKGADGVTNAAVAFVPGSLVGTGTLVYNNDGTFTYTPAAGELGTVSFNYTITDGDGDPSTATATITLTADSIPTLKVTDVTVNEDGLPARGAEPAGTSFGSNSHIGGGSFTITTGGDTVQLVEVKDALGNWINVTGGGTVNGANGTLVVSVAAGVYSYVYTLTDNLENHPDFITSDLDGISDAADPLAGEAFDVRVTDNDNSVSAIDTINVTVLDDAPVAANDTDAVSEDGTTTATGSVLTGAGTDGNVAGADTLGADGPAAGGAVVAVTGGSIGTAIVGTYGSLTLNANGTYSYVLNNGSAAVQALDTGETVTQDYTYTVRDGDGDETTATLRITITGANDAPVAIADTNWVLDVTTGPNPTTSGNVLQTLAHDGAPDAVSRGDVADTDVDVEPLTVTTVGSFTLTYGTLVLNSDGSYTYTLNASNAAVNALDDGEKLTDSFTYTAFDGTASATASLTITIFGTNDAPVVGTGTAVVSEEGLTNGIPDTTGVSDTTNSTTAGGTISITDVDGETYIVTLGNPGAVLTADGLPVTWTGVGTGALTGRVETSPGVFVNVITVTISNTGVYSVSLLQSVDHPTIDAEDIKSFSVPVNVSDGTATVGTTISVTIEDDRPIAVDDGQTTIEGAAAFNGNVLGNDQSGADTPAVVTTTGTFNLGHGSLVIAANGSYTYTPNASVPSGTVDSFTYTMRDADGDTATATLRITFQGDANVPTAGIANASVDDDALGGNPAGTGDLPDANADTDNNQATFSGTLPNNFGLDGAGKVTFAHLDGLFTNMGNEASAQYSWNEALSTLTVTGVRGVLFTLVLNQATGAYTITLMDNVLHANGADENNFIKNLTYQVIDNDNSVTNGTLTIDFDDDTPTATADTDAVTEDGTTTATGNVLTGVGTDGNVAGADWLGADGPALTGAVVAVTGGTIGTPIVGTYGSLTLNANGSYSFVLNNGAAAVQALDSGETATQIYTYTVRDGDGDETTATLTVTINGTNDAPVAVADTNWAIEDGASVSGNVLNTVAHNGAPDSVVRGDVADTDLDIETLTVTTTTTMNGLYGKVTIAADGSYTYSLYTQGENAAAYALVQARDVGEAPLSDVFNYTVTDGTESASSTLTISVFGINDAPVAIADTNWVLDVTTGPNPTTSGNVLQTLAHNGAPDAISRGDVADTDVDVEPLTVTTVGSFTLTYGTLVLNSDGSYTYTLNASNAAVNALDDGEKLTDSFTYTAFDGTASATASLTITIFGTNDAPVVGTGTAVVSEEGLTNGIPDTTGVSDTTNSTTAGGTISITDVDGETYIVTLGNPGAVLTADGLPVTWTGVGTGALTGRVETSPGNFVTVIQITISNTGVYSVTLSQSVDHPTINAEDIKTFVVPVSVSDGTVTVPATLTVTIEDDRPIAVDDGQTTIEGAAAFGGNVLGNDQSGADTPAVVTLVGAAAIGSNTVITGTFGSLTISANGAYTYTPNASVPSGSVDSFTYTMRDADSDTSTATLRITFAGDANLPTASAVTASVDDDGLAGNNPASISGDLPDPQPGPGGDGNEATFVGNLGFNFGLDGAAGPATDFAFTSTSGTVGTETVTYSWNNATSTLTATVNAGPRINTVLFDVVVNQATGTYTLTLRDNVIHAAGSNENDALASLNYTVTDSDGSTANGSLAITFDDDAPTLGVIQNGTANNLPGSAVSVGTLHFTDGADDTGPVGVISLTTTGITSSGYNIVTEQVGNVLTGYADVDGSGTKNAGDTSVFSLTVNPSAGTSGQYIFDLTAPLDGVTVNTPIGGSSSFGAGPTASQVLSTTGGTTNLAVISGWLAGGGFNAANWYNGTNTLPAGLTLSSVNGSTGGWGVANNNFTAGEFLRFDFGAPMDDFDAAGPYVAPAVTLPEVSYATFDLIGYGAGDTIQFRVHYTDGTSSNQTAAGAQTGYTLTAPAGKFIDWIDLYTSNAGGSGKVDLTAVGVRTTTVDRTLGFTVNLTDGDGDAVTGSFTVNVKDGNIPSTAAAPIVLDLDGNGLEFVTAAAGIAFDYDGDGEAEPTAWVGSNDGLLAIDLNGDGRINNGSEIVFGSGGQTDLQGLAAQYDSNGDGRLDANDVSFGQFVVWQDANANGVSDTGEVRSLSDAGIVSLDLTSDGNAYVTANGEVDVHGETTFTRTDGSTGIAGDVSFAIGGAIAAKSADQIRSGNLTTSIVAAALVGLVVDENPTAAQDNSNDIPGRVLSENAPLAGSFDPVVIADLQDNLVQSSFAPSHDFVQHIGEVENSVRAVDDSDFFAGIHDAPLSQMSELLADSSEPQTPDMANPLFAFGGGDSVMHSMLDMAAFTPPIAGNDNPAIPMPVEDVVRGAMPDMMIDQLIDSFSGDLGQPANDSHSGGVDGNDLLAGVLDQNIDAFHISTTTNSDFFGSHQYDLATTNN